VSSHKHFGDGHTITIIKQFHKIIQFLLLPVDQSKNEKCSGK